MCAVGLRSSVFRRRAKQRIVVIVVVVVAEVAVVAVVLVAIVVADVDVSRSW